MLARRVRSKWIVEINSDPVDDAVTLGCATAEQAARAASAHAKPGEEIIVIGPRGGRYAYDVVGRYCVRRVADPATKVWR